ncbi:MAG: family protein phosphatase [Chloroflexota bacterium]|jgi:protein phosphatase|nr:family protein phosphatase [Chloroflexota bacterium]
MPIEVALEIGHRTDVGRRRDHNEDCLGVYRPHLRDEIEHRGTLLAVADGMGGYAAGEVASHKAIEVIVETFYGDLDGGIESSLRRALIRANEAVREEAGKDSERAGMGTTIAVAVICDGDVIVANVGDSRVYLARGGELKQLSHDHSWVQELLEDGKITPEEAKRHPMRNVITRSLGGRPEVEPETQPRRRLQDGDTILICSDGLWGMVPADRILELVLREPVQSAADALIDAANEAGGHDNVTAVVCRILNSGYDDYDDDATEQLEPFQLQDTQPIPRIDV